MCKNAQILTYVQVYVRKTPLVQANCSCLLVICGPTSLNVCRYISGIILLFIVQYISQHHFQAVTDIAACVSDACRTKAKKVSPG